MPLFKYFSPAATIRFLKTWDVRLTPPHQFNDPFEMIPPVELLLEKEIFHSDSLRREFAARIADDFKGKIGASSQLAELFASSLLGELSVGAERHFLRMLPKAIRRQVHAGLPTMREQLQVGLAQAKQMLPEFAVRAEQTVHHTLQETIGAFCLTEDGAHPLMWAHYADEHRGAVIEFDEESRFFNRKRSHTDELGSLRKVHYSKVRPILNGDPGDNWFQVLALTKASEWAYEQEVRLLSRLSDADSVVGENIHLLRVSPLDIRSITVGCRADRNFVDQVILLLMSDSDTSHIKIRQSKIDQKSYLLNYVPLERRRNEILTQATTMRV